MSGIPTGFTLAAELSDGSEFQMRGHISSGMDPKEATRLVSGLTKGLRDAGFTVRANLLTESTWAVGHSDGPTNGPTDNVGDGWWCYE